MNRKIFIDTNVLVYAYDFSEPKKQAAALDSLDQLEETESGVLSTQVLSEFFVVVTRKLASPSHNRRLYSVKTSWRVYLS